MGKLKSRCCGSVELHPQVLLTGFVRVLENLESPEILLCHFPGLESPGKRPLVLESSGKLLNLGESRSRTVQGYYSNSFEEGLALVTPA